jgi:hypothetical protein
MSVRRCFLLLLLILPAALAAQPGLPAATAPTLRFELRWPEADPQWFELECHPGGAARYRSLPHSQPNQEPGAAKDDDATPYELTFTLSPAAQKLIFGLAPRLEQFQGSLDKTKTRIAFTGDKTLTYQDGAGHSSRLAYNYTSSPELAALAELMQGISSTVELKQQLELELRFDKLAVGNTLRSADDLAGLHRLRELQLIAPLLERIAADSSVIITARRHAQHILTAARGAAE